MHHLAVGHLLIVVGVHDLQKDNQILLFVEDTHLQEELTELVLIQDPISITVHMLEDLGELVQEFLMLSKLEVQNSLLKLGVGQFFMYHIGINGHSMQHLLPGDLFLSNIQHRAAGCTRVGVP